jgi:hypothetical protein
MATKLAFQKILKGILHTEDDDKQSHDSMGINKIHQASRQINEE